jgi:SAM-dependent methyltransferase
MDLISRAVVVPALASWLAELDGVPARLGKGGTVADVGCGYGAPTIAIAQAFTRSRVLGIDADDASIARARKAAAEAGLGSQVTFEVADAAGLPGREYDLVTFFDCLHDLGDPVGALRAAAGHLDDDAAILLVEPNAGDTVADNLNPVGAAYYGFSTLLCTPNALSQEAATVLGTQAGQARITEVAHQAGLGRVRRVGETPFNIVLELRR